MSEFKDILVDQSARVFDDHCGHAVVEAAEETWPDALWAALAEIELPLSLVDPEAGGAGADLEDIGALIRLSGRFAAPVPIGDTMVANWLWTQAGGAAVAGPVVMVAGDDTTCTLSGPPDQPRLSGVMQAVPWGRHASVLTVAQGPDGARLVLIPPETERRIDPQQNIAGDLRDGLTFADAAVAPDAIRAVPEGWSMRSLEEFGALIRCAQMVGAMERALELAIEHVNMRTQFGRPLAKFQAIQQQLAQAVEQSASASAALQSAIAAQMDASSDFGFAVAVAKVVVGRAAGMVAAIAHQVHGGIGFSREYGLQHVTRRLWAWREEFGTELVWQRRIGRSVLASKAGVWAFITSANESLTS